MEYKDFLECWDGIDRTLLFDPSWVMSSQWVQVKTRPLFTAWSYGDVSFTFSLPEPSLAVIVLSQLDERFFEKINGRCAWRFDFVLFKEGEEEAVGESSHARFISRSVNLEIDLEAGNYVVHVRLDRLVIRDSDYLQELTNECSPRDMTRVLTEKAKSCSAAVNFNWKEEGMHLPIPLSFLAGRSISAIKQGFEEAAIQGTEEEEGEGAEGEDEEGGDNGGEDEDKEKEETDEDEQGNEDSGTEKSVTGEDKQEEEDKMADPSELNTVFLGLKVYTKKNALVTIAAQLMAA